MEKLEATDMDDAVLFEFENDFVATLRCIPMAVRFKLDACGVKLSLRQWSRFTQATRRRLLLQPCADVEQAEVYRSVLIGLITEQANGEVNPLPAGSTVPWDAVDATPDAVRSFAHLVSVTPPSDRQWASLTPLQRFVLLKLSRDNHDNVNFVPALREFGLYSEPCEDEPASAVDKI